MTGERLMVPVSESVTLRNIVAYAVRRVAESDDGPATVHFVYPVAERGTEHVDSGKPEDLLDRVDVWADEDREGRPASVTVETAVVGADRYLFSPADYAEVLVEYGREHGIDTVVLDPGFNPSGATPLLPPLAAELELSDLDVVEAPVERQTRRPRVVGTGSLGQFLLLAGVSYAFYLVVGGTLATFDLVTGAVSAFIVATVLWRVSMTDTIRPVQLVARSLRFLVYVPYLLWAIVVANLQIAYVVLHPRLPIDPELVEFDAVLWSELSVTTLANSITLTPGTLTVDVSRQHFTVHTLTAGSREDLLAGGLERAVRFVFYGRAAARLPGPSERGDDGGEGS
jgi:multicomponent Na+:H+ antiporter subunit E